MYYYRIFGLSTASEVFLPEAMPMAETPAPEVTIRFGPVPTDVRSHPNAHMLDEDRYHCFIDENTLIFRMYGIDFLMENGDTVTISPLGEDYDPERLRLFILGTALGALNIQRGRLPVHGAAIEYKSNVTIITGRTGAGKSAMLGVLAAEGHRWLADDVAVVVPGPDGPMVIPAYPQRKLAADTAEHLGLDTAALPPLTEDGRPKVILRRPGEWQPEPRRLAAIIELEADHRAEGAITAPQLQKVSGHAALFLLMRNLYRRSLYDQLGFGPGRMKQLLSVTSAVDCWQLLRPAGGMLLEQTAALAGQVLRGEAEG